MFVSLGATVWPTGRFWASVLAVNRLLVASGLQICPRTFQGTPRSGRITVVPFQAVIYVTVRPEASIDRAVFISVPLSFFARSCFLNRASTSVGR
jgi:hypothetical protein